MDNSKQTWQKISIFILGIIFGILIQSLDFKFGPSFTLTESEKIKSIGNPNATVHIVEYSDFQCPFCERFFSNTFLEFKQNYIDTGKVLFTFKHFPLTSIHPQAKLAHQYSECAAQQNKFWEYHDELFVSQTSWSGAENAESQFQSLGQKLNLNLDQLTQCANHPDTIKQVETELAQGINQNVNGTPTLFVNGKALVGAVPYPQLQREVESALNK